MKPKPRAAPPPPAPPERAEDPPTYQDELDEALAETFPASDPIAPASASRPTRREVRTPGNTKDWQLEPGSKADNPAGEAARTEGEERGSDDGPLDSLGRAVSAPVRGAADASARERQLDDAADVDQDEANRARDA